MTPLPVLGGINNDDYDRLRDETSEQERKMKTWIFLDPEVARVQAEEPEYAPYKNAKQEFDAVSGISIVWGSMDQDFSIDFRNEILMGWLDELEDKVGEQPLDIVHIRQKLKRQATLCPTKMIPNHIGT